MRSIQTQRQFKLSGIIDENGKRINLPARIYVHNALMLATSSEQMKMVLAAMIEAIFTVMGKPSD